MGSRLPDVQCGRDVRSGPDGPTEALRPVERSGLSGFALVMLLGVTQFAAFSDRFLITLVSQPVKGDLGLSDTQLGLLQGSAFALLNALALPVAGRLADGGHRRAILIGSILLWSAATAAFGLMTSFTGLLCCRLLLGLGQAGVSPAAISLLSLRLGRQHLGTGLSCLTAGGSLGRSLALLGGGAVLAWLAMPGNPVQQLFGRADEALFGGPDPWRSLFVLAGLPNLLLLAGAVLIVEPRRVQGPAQVSVRVAAGWAIRRRSAYLPVLLIAACAMMVSQTLTAWSPAFYGRVFGLPPARSGMLLGSIVLFAAPVGHLLGGRVLDRAARRHRPVTALRMLGLGLVLVVPTAALMCFSDALPVSVAGFAGLVAVLGFTSPPSLAAIQWLTPVFLRGQVTAVFISVVTLASIGLGPLLIGILNDTVFGPDKVAYAMMTLFPLAAVLGASVAFRAASRPGAAVSPGLSGPTMRGAAAPSNGAAVPVRRS